jgi:hypothetical protein
VKPSNVFWAAVPVAAVVHNIWAVAYQREQLCDAMDRYRATQPILTDAAILLTAAHLSRRWPRWADPWAWMFAGAAYVLGRRQAVDQLAEVIPIDVNAVV